MKLSEYIARTVIDFSTAKGQEIVGVHTIDFDISVEANKQGDLIVVPHGSNRIKFSIEVKRK